MVEHRLPTICRLGNRAAIPTIVRVSVMLGDLLLSYSAVSAGMDVEAWINGRTGESRVVSSESSDEQPPRDDRDWHRVPDRNELDLGHRLGERFVSGVCPEIADDVCRVFSRRGGWRSFKEVLARRRLLDAWHAFANEAEREALLGWARSVGIEVIP